MSMSTFAAAAALALMIMNSSGPAGLGDATGPVGSGTAGSEYVGTATASPGIGGTQATNQNAYGGYGRQGVGRASGNWDASGTNPPQVANHAAITFAQCSSGSENLVWFTLGVSISGATALLWLGLLTQALAISAGITASFAAAALILTLL